MHSIFSFDVVVLVPIYKFVLFFVFNLDFKKYTPSRNCKQENMSVLFKSEFFRVSSFRDRDFSVLINLASAEEILKSRSKFQNKSLQSIKYVIYGPLISMLQIEE